jgi:hypothetical protein
MGVTGVTEVQTAGETVGHVIPVLHSIRWTASGVAVMLVTAMLFVVVATFRLTLEPRREEIEILRLHGATERWVRAPLWIEGGLLGATTGLVSAALAWGVRGEARGPVAIPALVSGRVGGARAGARPDLRVCRTVDPRPGARRGWRRGWRPVGGWVERDRTTPMGRGLGPAGGCRSTGSCHGRARTREQRVDDDADGAGTSDTRADPVTRSAAGRHRRQARPSRRRARRRATGCSTRRARRTASSWRVRPVRARRSAAD